MTDSEPQVLVRDQLDVELWGFGTDRGSSDWGRSFYRTDPATLTLDSEVTRFERAYTCLSRHFGSLKLKPPLSLSLLMIYGKDSQFKKALAGLSTAYDKAARSGRPADAHPVAATPATSVTVHGVAAGRDGTVSRDDVYCTRASPAAHPEPSKVEHFR